MTGVAISMPPRDSMAPNSQIPPDLASSDAGGRWSVWIAAGLGVGMAAPAPATVGGLWGLLLVPAVAWLEPLAVQLAALAGLILWAAIVVGRAARAMGPEKDPRAIVLDEIVSLPIVFLGVAPLNVANVTLGYALFRLFDACKPPPIRRAGQLSGGAGMLADDCIAAAYAWLALKSLLWLDFAAGLGWLAE